MTRSARALRATQWATPAVIVEVVPDGEYVPKIEASTSDDSLKLPAGTAPATAAQLSAIDAWLKSKGYTRTGTWAMRSGEYVAELA